MNKFIEIRKQLCFSLFTLLATCTVASGCKESSDIKTSPSLKDDPITTIIPASSIEKTMVFNAGVDGVHSYRIPSLVTAKDGSLLLFCEARKTSWRDKSPTDIALKRSTDNGQTWSEMKILFNGGSNAYMDPCAVVDKVTGRIFLFVCFWPASDQSTLANTAWMLTSDDNGQTWAAAKNVTGQIIPPGHYISGFGPGSGFQMEGESYQGRLIMPIRLYDGSINRNRTLYSDDHGVSWQIGLAASDGGEFQIAESPKNTLINNRRGDGVRYKARSLNGGNTWSQFEADIQLRTVAGGCQGSVFGVDSILFYTGPAGGPITEVTDNRSNFMIYRSKNGGDTWTQQHLLYNKAAGYSCITRLNDGRFAVVFESADSQGFIRTATRGTGWMRLDVLVLSEEIILKDHWFTH